MITKQKHWMRHFLAARSPAGPRARLSILIFHRVLPSLDPLFPGEADERRFDEVLAWLGSWFNILPLSAAVAMLQNGSLPARAACITFDDGYADNFTNALPILRKHNMPATFFITTGVLNGGRMWNDTIIEAIRGTSCESLELNSIGLGDVYLRTLEDKRNALSKIIPAMKHRDSTSRAHAVAAVADLCSVDLPKNLMMTSDQIRGLYSAGMGIGAHTVTHPILARCIESVARQEIADSREYLEDLIGDRIGLFAYPNGKFGEDYTEREVEIMAEMGFNAAVSTNAGASRPGDDLFQLRRFTPWDMKRWRFGLRLLENTFR